MEHGDEIAFLNHHKHLANCFAPDKLYALQTFARTVCGGLKIPVYNIPGQANVFLHIWLCP